MKLEQVIDVLKSHIEDDELREEIYLHLIEVACERPFKPERLLGIDVAYNNAFERYSR